MKNIFAILLALVLALTLPLTALAENATPSDITTPSDMDAAADAVPEEPDPYAATLQGLVMGWTDDGAILIRDEYAQLYQVNIDADYTNMDDAQFLAVGDYVTVLYDGRLTRSIPAQLTASYVSCFQRTGVVSELVYEDDGTFVGFIMAIDGEDAIRVDMQDCKSWGPIDLGTTVTVYFDGMMSRSIPASIYAMYIRTIHLAGQIVEITEADEEGVYGILMNDETFGFVLVWCDADTILYTELNVGDMITVATEGMMTMSIPAQMWAIEVLSMAVPAM